MQSPARISRFLLVVVNCQTAATVIRCTNQWQAVLLSNCNRSSEQLHANTDPGCSQCASRVSISAVLTTHKLIMGKSARVYAAISDCCHVQRLCIAKYLNLNSRVNVALYLTLCHIVDHILNP